MSMASEAQRRAMYSAKAGDSTLGIPKKVGAEFVKSDTGGKLPERAGGTKKGWYSGEKKASSNRGSVLYDKGK